MILLFLYLNHLYKCARAYDSVQANQFQLECCYRWLALESYVVKKKYPKPHKSPSNPGRRGKGGGGVPESTQP